MKFRTECPLPSYPFKLSPFRPVVALGSCFAANITARMTQCLWNAFNPGGTLFNPASVALVLRLLTGFSHGETIVSSLFHADGKWLSWWSDSSMTAESPEEIVAEFTRRSQLTAKLLNSAQVLLITFGTAWVYELIDSPVRIVANCHKQPSSFFRRRRLSIDEIADEWTTLLTDLTSLYPSLNIIFTLSPVRHIKDGLEGNNRSKAILMLAIEEICHRSERAHYFPAYEMVADDLRDYRFYNSDLVHPSEQAVDYIWEKFRESLLDDAGRARLKEGDAIVRGWLHRPNAQLAGSLSPQTIMQKKTRKGQILERYALFCRQASEAYGNSLGCAPLPS